VSCSALVDPDAGCELVGGDATPVCNAAGECVQCTASKDAACSGTTPVCGEDETCQPCVAHEECESGGCQLAGANRGACFEVADTVWVDDDEACPGAGTAEEPYCDFATALAGLGAGEVRLVRAKAGVYGEVIEGVPVNAIVGIVGDGLVEITGADANEPNVRVSDNTLILGDITVRGSESLGVECGSSGTLRLDDVSIRSNTGVGLESDTCDTILNRVVIRGNLAGGLRVIEGTLEVVNSVIAANGGLGSIIPGLNLNNTQAAMLYTTVAGNQGSGADSITCSTANLTIVNSIVTGGAAESIAPGCTGTVILNSLVDTASYVTGSNASVSATNPDWFVNYASGDFRLSPLAPTSWATVAQWMAGHPELDLDGTPRPQSAPGYPGADEPE
jgi:hypothetical protein